MILNRLKSIAASLLIALCAVCTIGIGSASAQRGFRGARSTRVIVFPRFHRRAFFGYPFWGYGYWGYSYYSSYYYNSPWYLQEQGFRDGISRGKSDARHHKADDPKSHKHYRKSESLTYRNAFVKGYNEGYHDYVSR